MKLNSKIHGIIDYLVVVCLIAAPTLFQLPSVTSLMTYTIAGIHLVLTATTNFEMGVIKIIPLKIHGIIELIVSVALVGIAFILGNIEGALARNFYLGFAIAVFITWVITEYKSTDQKSTS